MKENKWQFVGGGGLFILEQEDLSEYMLRGVSFGRMKNEKGDSGGKSKVMEMMRLEVESKVQFYSSGELYLF